MVITNVISDVFCLTRLGLVNNYLVREADGFTLIDTGIPGTAPGILEAAKSLGSPIRRILLTHAHQDHVGSVDALAALLPGVELAIGARESRLLARDFSLDADEPKTKLGGLFPKVKTRPTVLLQPGDRYGSLEAIWTPGHTPGHLSYLDRRTGALIAGDVAVTVGELRAATDPLWYFPFAAFATWNKALEAASLRTVADLKPVVLGAGHGRPVLSGTAEAVQKALARLG